MNQNFRTALVPLLAVMSTVAGVTGGALHASASTRQCSASSRDTHLVIAGQLARFEVTDTCEMRTLTIIAGDGKTGMTLAGVNRGSGHDLTVRIRVPLGTRRGLVLYPSASTGTGHVADLHPVTVNAPLKNGACSVMHENARSVSPGGKARFEVSDTCRMEGLEVALFGGSPADFSVSGYNPAWGNDLTVSVKIPAGAKPQKLRSMAFTSKGTRIRQFVILGELDTVTVR